jgi:membrane fusion protein, multidrug efflux system
VRRDLMDRRRLCVALCVFLPLAGAPQPVPVVAVARPTETETAAFDFPCRVAPSETVEGRSPLSGAVEEVRVRVGDAVKAGEVLIELAPRNLKQDLSLAEADVKNREAELNKAEKALAQAQKPAKGKADELDVAKARAERDLAAVRLKVVRAEVDRLQREKDAAKVKAPIGGSVVSIVSAGDQVEGGPRAASVLAKIARLDLVLAAFEMDEANLLRMKERLRKGELAAKKATEVEVLLRLHGEKEFGHRGTLRTVDNRADPKTRRIHFDAAFPNADGALTKAALTPPPKVPKGKREEPALVRLTCGDARRVLLVPPSSVGVDEGEGMFVYLVDEKNVVEKRPVKLGPLIDGLQGIEEGIKPGEWVAVGTGRPELDAKAQPLTPGVFAQDARLAGLRPGVTVRPVRVTIPRPAK